MCTIRYTFMTCVARLVDDKSRSDESRVERAPGLRPCRSVATTGDWHRYVDLVYQGDMWCVMGVGEDRCVATYPDLKVSGACRMVMSHVLY